MARNGIYLARAREQIAQQRAENEREHRRRVDDAYRRVPGLRALDQTLQQQMITLVGLTMRHGSDPTDELRALERANLDTQAQRAELLTSYHLPVDYTDDIYTCPDCRDTGYIHGQPCRCLLRRYNAELTRDLSRLLQSGDESFEHFDLTLYDESARPKMERVFQVCRTFAQTFRPGTMNLLLQGGTGLGKTYLSACIARVVAGAGYAVAYETAASALDAFECAKFQRSSADGEAAAQRVEQYLGCDPDDPRRSRHGNDHGLFHERPLHAHQHAPDAQKGHHHQHQLLQRGAAEKIHAADPVAHRGRIPDAPVRGSGHPADQKGARSMNQHEITERRPLLDASGNLTEPGYAKTLLPIYRRSDIKAGKMRIKEWDYYCINNGHFALALTIADNSYMGLDSISLLNLDEGWEITKSPMRAFTNGRIGLPESSETGDVHSAGRNYSILFKNEGDKRVLIAQMKNFGPEGSLYAKVTLSDIPPESMVIATPFDKDKHFYYNQKINCMRAEGTVTYGYHNRTYTFDPADSFAVLDWGRGVWTYKNTWYWGSASGLVDGERFGFNIGYGFGNTSAASENMLFYKGRAHKLSQVTFHIPGDGGRRTPDYMQPWTFTSDDGRFEMDYTPVLDRASCSDVGLIKSDQHQVFGVFNGRAVLDDGTVLNVKDLPGFAEKVINKW